MSNEALWEGTFGDEYTVRNDSNLSVRDAFFKDLLERHNVKSLLEIGCNVGGNLVGISKYVKNVWGVDVNKKALRILHSRATDIGVGWASGYDLPFKDDFFDCAMTCGVLIHQKPEEAEKMMQEAIRVSGKYVLCMEYAATAFEEISYRGNSGALYKGPYGDIYTNRYGLRLIETGFLGKEKGFDNVTYWMMARY